ncbi:MAG: methyltransferase domain-containing protein [Streptosporangiales bacterium]|nr:methyltransferase domain-containing protein [Streptosporangiales bacterium]
MPQHQVYTHGHHESVRRSHEWRTAANSAAYLTDRLRPGASLLDVGCGSGTITADLAALVAPGTVTAIDASADILEAAERVAAGRGLTNLRFEVADVHALPYADDAFAVVHAHQVLQHLADPVAALREMRRVVAADGVVAARDADYAAMTWHPDVPELDEWLALYHRVATHNRGEPDAGRRLQVWARAAGFTDVACTASAWCYASPDDRARWSGTWAERVTRSAFAEQAVGYGYATAADLDRIAAGWRVWGAEPDGWFGVLHGEVLCRG